MTYNRAHGLTHSTGRFLYVSHTVCKFHHNWEQTLERKLHIRLLSLFCVLVWHIDRWALQFRSMCWIRGNFFPRSFTQLCEQKKKKRLDFGSFRCQLNVEVTYLVQTELTLNRTYTKNKQFLKLFCCYWIRVPNMRYSVGLQETLVQQLPFRTIRWPVFDLCFQNGISNLQRHDTDILF